MATKIIRGMNGRARVARDASPIGWRKSTLATKTIEELKIELADVERCIALRLTDKDLCNDVSKYIAYRDRLTQAIESK